MRFWIYRNNILFSPNLLWIANNQTVFLDLMIDFLNIYNIHSGLQYMYKPKSRQCWTSDSLWSSQSDRRGVSAGAGSYVRPADIVVRPRYTRTVGNKHKQNHQLKPTLSVPTNNKQN